MFFIRRPLRSLLFVSIMCAALYVLNPRINEQTKENIVDGENTHKYNTMLDPLRYNLLNHFAFQYLDVEIEESNNHSDKYVKANSSIGNANDSNHTSHDVLETNVTSKKSKTMNIVELTKLMKKYNKIYDHEVLKRAQNADVFYISAVVSNNIHTGAYITVTGWQGKKHSKRDIFCCVQYLNKFSVFKVVQKNIIDLSHIKLITATQFICPVPTSYSQVTGMKVGLAMTEDSCTKASYIDVESEEIPHAGSKQSLAICSKVLYGDYFSAERVLEWLELNRVLGVDKVVLYTFNITDDVKAVLQYYASEGFLVVKEFDFPLKFRFPRYLGQKYMMAYMDEQVVVYDCVARLHKYSYLAILDVDEFLMSRLHHASDYKSLMKQLSEQNPKAAGFALKSCVFITDWNKTAVESDTFVDQYTLRTPPLWDRTKNIILPDRVKLSTIWTHGFTPLHNYYTVKLTHKAAVIYHYRKCRDQWQRLNGCLSVHDQFSDKAMKRVVDKYRDFIRKVQRITLPGKRNTDHG